MRGLEQRARRAAPATTLTDDPVRRSSHSSETTSLQRSTGCPILQERRSGTGTHPLAAASMHPRSSPLRSPDTAGWTDRRPAGAAAKYRNTAPARFDRGTGRDGIDHRRSQPIQAFVSVRFRRPFVDQLREVTDVSQGSSGRRRQRRPRRLDEIEANEIALLPFVARHLPPRHRLERPGVAGARPARPLGDAPFLAAIAGEKHHDLVRLAKLVGPEDQGFGLIDRHRYILFTVAVRGFAVRGFGNPGNQRVLGFVELPSWL